MNIITTTDRISKINQLNEFLELKGEKFQVELRSIYKANEGLKEGLVLKSELFNCCPTIYPSEQFYSSSIVDEYEYLKEVFLQQSINFNIQSYINKDYILSNVFPRIVSSDKKENLIANNTVFIPILDLCIYFTIEIPEFSKEQFGASIQITESLLNTLNLIKEEIYIASISNISEIVSITNINDIIKQNTSLIDLPISNLPLYMVSTLSNYYGASAIFVSKICQKLAENIVNKKFYIIPSSIHECLIIPYSEEMMFDIHDMVNEINDTELSAEDILSYNVYLYDDGNITALF